MDHTSSQPSDDDVPNSHQVIDLQEMSGGTTQIGTENNVNNTNNIKSQNNVQQQNSFTCKSVNIVNHYHGLDNRARQEHVGQVFVAPAHVADASIQVPMHWEKQTEDLTVINLKSTDPEYKEVEANFRATLNNSNITVTKVERVQSKALYLQYQIKKEQMQSLNPNIAVEKTLWHGTTYDRIDNINREGFNRSYCGKNATLFGQGSYFTVRSVYSAQAQYSSPDPNTGDRKIYQCKVLVAHVCQGNSQMRTLPPRTGNVYYDSASDNLHNPSTYVIFNDTQAYPEYIITFK